MKNGAKGGDDCLRFRVVGYVDRICDVKLDQIAEPYRDFSRQHLRGMLYLLWEPILHIEPAEVVAAVLAPERVAFGQSSIHWKICPMRLGLDVLTITLHPDV